MKNNSRFFKLSFFITVALTMVACGTSTTEENPDIGGTTTNSNYSGPAAATNDVQNFKLSVWDNLVSTDRCGECHSTGGQSPTFVNDEDINIAYAQMNTITNLDDPATSAIVAKVGGGHNCWLGSDTACADTITSYIENWAGGSAGTITRVTLRAPDIRDPGDTKAFPDSSADFSDIHTDILLPYCSGCHVEGEQTPYIGSSNLDTAYEAAQSKIDLQTPASSRLVSRLRNEFHNCWDNNCTTSANEMEAYLTAFANGITSEAIDPDLVASKALNLALDGLPANTGGRYEDHIIAQYEFKTNEGNIAYDTSGIEPALNLNLSGNVEWLSSWGLKFGPAVTTDDITTNDVPGKAQGSTSASSKLHDLITASGEYSVEAWIVPGNVSQEDSRIINYSGSPSARNLTLGQTLYNYDFMHRSTTTDQNTAFSTADDDERLQATLQHVVITFTPGEARQIYINGVNTGDVDMEDAGLLNEWDNSFAFILGSETDRSNAWAGTLRLVAIHNRALSDEQILQNYSVGVGEKFFLLFSVEHLIDVEESFVVFEVSQFDNYSYLFNAPFFVSLNNEETPDNIVVKGIKLGINGKEATIGQAFKNLDITLNESDYVVGEGQVLSRMGTIIAQEQGPDADEFFLSFEQLGTHTNVIVEADPPAAPAAEDADEQSQIGLKTFDEINASMSVMTGVAKTHTAVAETFNTVRQQLPTVETIDGFLSAHQMAITQLAIQYCDALVEDVTLRTGFFPGFDFSESYTTAFDAAGKNLVISPLLTNILGTNIDTQPSDTDVTDEIEDLIDIVSACTPSPDDDCTSRTTTVVKASCAAVLGSAVMLVQ